MIYNVGLEAMTLGQLVVTILADPAGLRSTVAIAPSQGLSSSGSVLVCGSSVLFCICFRREKGRYKNLPETSRLC